MLVSQGYGIQLAVVIEQLSNKASELYKGIEEAIGIKVRKEYKLNFKHI